MQHSGYSTWRTSRTLREILTGPDCPERRQRVEELVEVYQPVWVETVKWALRTYGAKDATVDAEDIVGDEIVKVLAPDSEYFKTYDKHRSVRAWIKACMEHRVIDFLRRKVPEPLEEASTSVEACSVIDEREMYELFRTSLRIADDICKQRNMEEEMRIFRAVRSTQDKLTPEERRERGWTEWRERTAVSRIWELIRDEAIPMAASLVSDAPEDATEVGQELWDRIRGLKTVTLPEARAD